ncbi:uncharacterized protein EI97DRAFT_261766 [Westerdykella ornata]|uniref:Uncharacterized protein n=1 Tax=Westerdykella ornata TaxID=318751 RepID=A0A6A6J515_WESOR|nr:uncharacterized protein EI97DRAFT_261766 [Westerdykella ornata]KAF2271680.1 hypothetical protein EI97DRAFT_261766 [Westerdykella ornata]
MDQFILGIFPLGIYHHGQPFCTVLFSSECLAGCIPTVPQQVLLAARDSCLGGLLVSFVYSSPIITDFHNPAESRSALPLTVETHPQYLSEALLLAAYVPAIPHHTPQDTTPRHTESLKSELLFVDASAVPPHQTATPPSPLFVFLPRSLRSL